MNRPLSCDAQNNGQGDDPVLYSLSDGLATLTLNRPGKLNCLNVAMHDRLRDILDQISTNPSVRAVLLTGAGRGFCAGQDLNERHRLPGESPQDLGQTIGNLWNPLARTLHYLSVPTICAVNGIAAGAGVGIALACDVVIAARSANFLLSFSKVGLVPDAGSSYYLPRLLGNARAMGLALFGDKLPASEAEAWGLIWRCVEDEELLSVAIERATSLAHGPTVALSAAKLAISASLENSFEEQIEFERKMQRRCGFSDDFREGVSAFVERRMPRFSGV